MEPTEIRRPLRLLARKFTSDEVNQMAVQLLNKGLHPKLVREALRKRGVTWEYHYLPAVNPWLQKRERLRRLKRLGQTICQGCDGAKRIGAPLCGECLEKKWSPEVTITRPAS